VRCLDATLEGGGGRDTEIVTCVSIKRNKHKQADMHKRNSRTKTSQHERRRILVLTERNENSHTCTLARTLARTHLQLIAEQLVSEEVGRGETGDVEESECCSSGVEHVAVAVAVAVAARTVVANGVVEICPQGSGEEVAQRGQGELVSDQHCAHSPQCSSPQSRSTAA
jgi:hypothetical protein